MPFLVPTVAASATRALPVLQTIAARVPGARFVAGALPAVSFPNSARALIQGMLNFAPLKAVLAAFGGLSVVESLTPGNTIPLVPPALGIELGGEAAPPVEGGTVVKRWEANGVPMVRLADGKLGAYSKKRGSWKFWRPKKPIVMYAGGSENLKTLLRADRATTRQLGRLKKAIDRRFPKPRAPRRTRATTHAMDGDIIIESGAGSVAKKR